MQPVNQQGLDVRSTPRAEMNLFPLDTFAYEFPGRELKIESLLINGLHFFSCVNHRDV